MHVSSDFRLEGYRGKEGEGGIQEEGGGGRDTGEGGEGGMRGMGHLCIILKAASALIR